jgi:uncharacterized membrane protein YgdD (TMEM256/DUF423 family)
LEETLAARGMAATWETAALYHLVHAVVLLVLALARPKARWAFRLFVAGIGLFSGSLYLYSVSGVKILAYLTPLGGLCLLAGWALLFCHKRNA